MIYEFAMDRVFGTHRSRRLPPEQFEVREVLRTRKGPTHVGLFSKEFVRAERRENQERVAATRDAWVGGS